MWIQGLLGGVLVQAQGSHSLCLTHGTWCELQSDLCLVAACAGRGGTFERMAAKSAKGYLERCSGHAKVNDSLFRVCKSLEDLEQSIVWAESGSL